jgi:lipoate-protein ligase A
VRKSHPDRCLRPGRAHGARRVQSRTVISGRFLSVEPSAHALSLAGVDLVASSPPVVRVEAAREVVVVLPRSRDPEREVDLDACRRDGVPVVVRPSGGGAVVLAPGVVAASVLTALPAGAHFPQPLFRGFGAAVAGALERCGVRPVTVRGTSDLCLGDRKIAGSSLRLWWGRALYQVSVLLAVDVSLLERYLPLPSRQPDYRRGRSHREFVTTLSSAGFAVTETALTAALGSALGGVDAAAILRSARPCV